MKTPIGLAFVFAASLLAQPPATFNSPEEARDAFVQCMEKDAPLRTVFGAAVAALASGDEVQDKNYHNELLSALKVRADLAPDPMNSDRVYIEIGADSWPFPVPIDRKNGKWSFNLKEGQDEIRYRIIGGNELDMIELCHGYVAAQFEYAEEDRNSNGVLEYARRFISSPGKKDGLFWKGEDSPVPEEFAKAVIAEGYHPEQGKAEPYHGYFFKILDGQGPDADGGTRDYVVRGFAIGGFALVAYPAKYGSSGIKTFIVNQDDIVYDKDLGPTTTSIVHAMTRFNPDASWRELPD